MSKDLSTDNQWNNVTCDKYDYMIAGFCGGVAGIIDVLFVGMPGDSILGNFSDQESDELVKKFASLSGWKPREGKEDSVASAIGFLERNFAVNYDHRHSVDVDNLFSMSTKNHHYKSLAHSPDPVGLFFSILDQFMNTASFVSGGELIRIDTTDRESPLKGSNLVAKIFSGFSNWLGHIMSDVAGSSGSRGNAGRGAGVPVPFMELFQFFDFGSLQVGDDRQTFAMVMTRVFQEGYDLRFAAAMAVPVIVEELLIRGLWAIRRHYCKGYPWKECIPSTSHGDLRIMLIVGNSVLCIFDITDASIRSGFGSNMVLFFLRLNYVAWVRLIILVFKELIIRCGPSVKKAFKAFIKEVMYNIKTESEQRKINEFYERVRKYDGEMAVMYKLFVEEVEKEYIEIHREIEKAFDQNLKNGDRIEGAVELAEKCKVEDTKIIHNYKELDDIFL